MTGIDNFRRTENIEVLYYIQDLSILDPLSGNPVNIDIFQVFQTMTIPHVYDEPLHQLIIAVWLQTRQMKITNFK